MWPLLNSMITSVARAQSPELITFVFGSDLGAIAYNLTRSAEPKGRLITLNHTRLT